MRQALNVKQEHSTIDDMPLAYWLISWNNDGAMLPLDLDLKNMSW
jgi:hypothetical protein